jgi:predicted 2-oxoglutarate/Fe(II)-dependent dioxygenase YbiX
MLNITVGDRAPPIVGTAAGGRFYAEDVQIGRPVMLITLGGAEPGAAIKCCETVAAWRKHLTREIDLVALVPVDPRYAHPLAVHVSEGQPFAALMVDGAPAIAVLDRNWRIVHLGAFGAEVDLAALHQRLKPQLFCGPPATLSLPAPALVIPNVLAPETCRGLIAHFEQSPHTQGLMASVIAGAAAAKLDAGKKHRRDIELTPGDALHAEVVKVLAQRCAPEIKRAFQFDVAFADRILIARYDDAGGFFKRHRDNLSPQTAFRDFAVSMNLNTGEYEGGELLFPEFSDDRYAPPAGSAAVFSASLLHEAMPVTRGRRYVALSFLSGAKAQAQTSHAA